MLVVLLFCFFIIGGFIVFIKFRFFIFGFRIFSRVIKIENKNDDKLFEFFNSNFFVLKEKKFVKLKILIDNLFEIIIKISDFVEKL